MLAMTAMAPQLHVSWRKNFSLWCSEDTMWHLNFELDIVVRYWLSIVTTIINIRLSLVTVSAYVRWRFELWECNKNLKLVGNPSYSFFFIQFHLHHKSLHCQLYLALHQNLWVDIIGLQITKCLDNKYEHSKASIHFVQTFCDLQPNYAYYLKQNLED